MNDDSRLETSYIRPITTGGDANQLKKAILEVTGNDEENCRLNITPTPTEAELDELASWTREWIYDDVLVNTSISSAIAMVRYVMKTRQWKRFFDNAVRNHGDAGKEVILETLYDFCAELNRHQKKISARERRAKQAADRTRKSREAHQDVGQVA